MAWVKPDDREGGLTIRQGRILRWVATGWADRKQGPTNRELIIFLGIKTTTRNATAILAPLLKKRLLTRSRGKGGGRKHRSLRLTPLGETWLTTYPERQLDLTLPPV